MVYYMLLFFICCLKSSYYCLFYLLLLHMKLIVLILFCLFYLLFYILFCALYLPRNPLQWYGTALPRANLRPTESGTGKRGTVLVQPRGRERPAVAQRGFLPHLPGRGGITPLLSCGSAEREGTPALSARNIRTVAAAGTRSDGRHNAAQAGSSPRSRRSTENTHTLRKPVPRGGNMKKRPQHLAIPMKSRNFAPLFSIIERCTHRVMVRLSINHLI